MTDDSSKLVDMDDLDAFEKDFFNGKPAAADEPKEKPEVVDDEEEPEIVADADATEENEDEDDQEEAEEEPKPAPKKKSSVQDRINELTAKAREAERREADLRRELEQLRVRKPEDDTKSETKPVREQPDPDQPKPDAVDEDGEPLYPLGEFDPKFIRDLTRHTINKEHEALRTKEAEEAKQRQIELEQEALQTSWGEKVQEAEKELPDLRAKLTELTDTFQSLEPAYGEFLAATVMSCDYGPQIMYYLSQNIGEAQKIVASGPAAATLAIGRLDAKFTPSQEEKRNTKKVSSAPEPPENRVRGSAGRFNVAPDTDDLDAFERAFFKK